MVDSTIRPATLDDVPLITDMAMELGYPATNELTRERLKVIIETPGHAVFVACLAGGSVVGWIHVFLAPRVQTDPFAELGGLVVEELYRGCGMGKALLTMALQWSQDQGVKRLRSRSRAERVSAHSFYDRFGFTLTKEQHVYDLPVPVPHE